MVGDFKFLKGINCSVFWSEDCVKTLCSQDRCQKRDWLNGKISNSPSFTNRYLILGKRMFWYMYTIRMSIVWHWDLERKIARTTIGRTDSAHFLPLYIGYTIRSKTEFTNSSFYWLFFLYYSWTRWVNMQCTFLGVIVSCLDFESKKRCIWQKG